MRSTIVAAFTRRLVPLFCCAYSAADACALDAQPEGCVPGRILETAGSDRDVWLAATCKPFGGYRSSDELAEEFFPGVFRLQGIFDDLALCAAAIEAAVFDL